MRYEVSGIHCLNILNILRKHFFCSKKPSELLIKFGSYRDNRVEEIIIHPNFYKTIDTLQNNIALMMLENEVKTQLPCIMRSEVADNLCHVFSWSSSKFFENAMKLDNVEVFTKGECYTSHLILGKKHEKYVNKGVNNICVGNADNHELNVVRFFACTKYFLILFK